MNKEVEVQTSPELVYIVQRYQSIVGVYRHFVDASQVANTCIAKGQLCDIICKNVL